MKKTLIAVASLLFLVVPAFAQGPAHGGGSHGGPGQVRGGTGGHEHGGTPRVVTPREEHGHQGQVKHNPDYHPRGEQRPPQARGGEPRGGERGGERGRGEPRHVQGGRIEHGYFHKHYENHHFFWGHCHWFGPRFYVGSRFWYGDFWFVIMDQVPAYWGDDEVVVIDDGGVYYLYDYRYNQRIIINIYIE